MRSFSATSKVSLTFSLLMEIEFPANSRFASPFDFKNPDFSEIKSITLLPTTSDFEIDSDWTHHIKGDYIYIEGSVTNISSSKTISFVHRC